MTVTDCVRPLRSSVLCRLDPAVVRLVEESPGGDPQNTAMPGRLFAHGGFAHATRGP